MIASDLAAEPEATVPAGETAEPRPTFAQLYESHFSFVWRSARRLGTPQATTDDVVQEIFVVVYRKLPKFEGRSSINTWLFGIVVNVVRAHRRALRAKHPHALWTQADADPASLTDTAAGPHELATKGEAARLVERLLDALDDDKREVFVLAELEQMSAPDIARAIAIPLNTVYSRLRLARQEFAASAARHRARDEWRTR
jgi:RNA polymerase sigma-70 factor (ECF subfamily)